MSARRRLVPCVLAMLLGWAGASEVCAQEAPEAEDAQETPPEPSAAAREHYRAAIEFFEARDFRSAISEFHLAARVVPSANLWYNIARAHEELSELPEAIEHYRFYLRDAVDARDREEVEARIASLAERHEAAVAAARSAPTTGQLRLSSNLEGARVQVDGEDVGQTPLDAPFDLEQGHHQLTLDLDGHIPFRSSVTIEPGLTTAAYADLTTATSYRSVRGRRIWTWVVGALAIAGVGTAIGLGAHARGLQDENLTDARRWARFSDVTLGVSGVLAVGAVILYFIEGRAIGTERIGGTEGSDP